MIPFHWELSAHLTSAFHLESWTEINTEKGRGSDNGKAASWLLSSSFLNLLRDAHGWNEKKKIIKTVKATLYLNLKSYIRKGFRGIKRKTNKISCQKELHWSLKMKLMASNILGLYSKSPEIQMHSVYRPTSHIHLNGSECISANSRGEKVTF